jgi:aminoglycoside 3-N-acetyltransferase I
MKKKEKQFEVKRLKKNDINSFKSLIKMFNEVFENNKLELPKKGYLKKQLSKPDFVAFAAFQNKKLAGGMTAFILPKYYSKGSEIFIYDVAVRKQYQRKGIGKMMMDALKDYSKKEKIKDIFVAANVEDKHALDFYNATGGKAEQVVHFNYKAN